MEKRLKFPKMAFALIVYMSFGCGLMFGAPSVQPLEHSPSELAWKAWLQDGSRQNSTPRRITTKSLFVLPNFAGPESLPACADGYRADPMGRCVKIVKVDETAHLEFLLHKLNSQFATDTSSNQDEFYDYDSETELPDNAGPVQFSIPLALPNTDSKSEESVPGDYVVIAKKDSQDVKNDDTPIKAPTSSPEVVPEEFFLANSPAPAITGTVKQNSSDTVGPLSVLFQNSSNTGITLLIPSNGKFENVSEANKNENNFDPPKNDEQQKHANETEKLVETHDDPVKNIDSTENTLNAKTGSTTKTTISTTNYVGNGDKLNKLEPIDSSSASSNDFIKQVEQTHDNPPKVPKNDTLVDEIEALKHVVQLPHNNTHHHHQHTNENTFNNTIFKLKTTINNPEPEERPVHHKDDTRKEIPVEEYHPTLAESNRDIDIEEKIKLISRFADVSRNTGETNPIEHHRRPPNNFVLFPSASNPIPSHEQFKKSPDMSVEPGSLVRFPNNNERPPYPPNSIFGIHPPAINSHGTFQSVPHATKDYYAQPNNNQETPQWSPYGWNTNSNPSGEHKLMDLWSRLPMVQRYPYSEHYPPRFQPPYQQDPQDLGVRMNGRHTPGNYRQGRDEVVRRGQYYPHQQPAGHKRNRHPHLRDSEKLSRLFDSYNGR